MDRPRHRAARHATADSCLWLGDIPTAWGSQSRLKRVLYHGIPRDVPQPWLKKIVMKRYRDRNSGRHLGYAIVCFRDSAETAEMLKVLDGLNVEPASIFRPEELAEGGRASDLTTDSGFTLRANLAEHGDTAIANPVGLEESSVAGLDPSLVEQLRPLSDVELRKRIDLLARKADAEASSGRLRVAASGVEAASGRTALAEAVLAYDQCPRSMRYVQGSLLPDTLADQLLAELDVLRWPAKNHRPTLTSDRYLVLLANVSNDCYGKLRQLCAKLMSWAAPDSQYSAVAVTKNFVASPHIDERDRCPQYAVSLGSFSGGELCVDSIDEDGNHCIAVVETRNRIARIDGRHVHWVRTFSGCDRYSLIFYDTSDRCPEPVGPAFDTSWTPACAEVDMEGSNDIVSRKSRKAGSEAPRVKKEISASSSSTHVCTGCGQTFPSRNALFKHLGDSGCSGAARQSIRRYLILYGYIGTDYHGSQKNAPQTESQYPTVEGALLAGVKSAMLEKFGATSVSVEVRSRASRTDRGVHALSNAVCLSLETKFDASSDTSACVAALDASAVADAVRQHLPSNLRLVAQFDLQGITNFDARFACQKREYWYFVPYSALYLPQERSPDGSTLLTNDDEEFREDEDQWVWVLGLLDNWSEDSLRSFAELRLAQASQKQDVAPPVIEKVDPYRQRGSGYLKFSDASAANAACALLDGAEGPSEVSGESRKQLIVLPATEARIRRAVHFRLRGILSRLTGTRSFHNFSPGFTDGTSDPRSVRSVYRCRSELRSGFRDLCSGRDFAVLRVTGRDFLYRQILSMCGLVVAITRGAVPEAYMDLAFGNTSLEVPIVPSGNLVLSECIFRDGAFRPDCADDTGARGELLEAVVTEVSSETNARCFDRFLEELDEEIAPRLRQVLSIAKDHKTDLEPTSDCPSLERNTETTHLSDSSSASNLQRCEVSEDA